ncbi:type II secretion system F family protein [Aureliella helgolandensis]|uniref:Type II secretion system protein F n=1 Tax=Aureliella helgolandensis TaxID=2527968 RepID=A0A518G032_9BACT|nr:type II secretion system F family protein [Aureliella helgolandensis]QDV21967.1 Type II secretion system protein F [Aureliella helgolandensis]
MMSLGALAAFCRRMGIGLKAGVDILRLLENETKSGNAQHQRVMSRVLEEIRNGNTFSKAMFQEKQYFPPLLIQMVNASELGGRTEAMFAYMADYYEQLKRTRALFLSKISWPLIQLFMAVGIIGLVILIQGLLTPNTPGSYDASGVGLRGVNGFFIYCFVVSSFFGAVSLVGYGVWKNWFNCHRLLMPLIQRIPGIGTALVTLGLSRLSMTMSMLLNAGVEARRSLRQGFLSTGNYYFIGGMDLAVAEVGKGSSFGEAFTASGVLPQEFVEAVRIGELSGTETESFDHLAEQYRQRAQAALSTIATVAGIAIWMGIILLMAFMIIRMAMSYINLLNGFLP